MWVCVGLSQHQVMKLVGDASEVFSKGVAGYVVIDGVGFGVFFMRFERGEVIAVIFFLVVQRTWQQFIRWQRNLGYRSAGAKAVKVSEEDAVHGEGAFLGIYCSKKLEG